jgi:hypothetical protein
VLCFFKNIEEARSFRKLTEEKRRTRSAYR